MLSRALKILTILRVCLFTSFEELVSFSAQIHIAALAALVALMLDLARHCLIAVTAAVDCIWYYIRFLPHTVLGRVAGWIAGGIYSSYLESRDVFHGNTYPLAT